MALIRADEKIKASFRDISDKYEQNSSVDSFLTTIGSDMATARVMVVYFTMPITSEDLRKISPRQRDIRKMAENAFWSSNFEFEMLSRKCDCYIVNVTEMDEHLAPSVYICDPTGRTYKKIDGPMGSNALIPEMYKAVKEKTPDINKVIDEDLKRVGLLLLNYEKIMKIEADEKKAINKKTGLLSPAQRTYFNAQKRPIKKTISELEISLR